MSLRDKSPQDQFVSRPLGADVPTVMSPGSWLCVGSSPSGSAAILTPPGCWHSAHARSYFTVTSWLSLSQQRPLWESVGVQSSGVPSWHQLSHSFITIGGKYYEFLTWINGYNQCKQYFFFLLFLADSWWCSLLQLPCEATQSRTAATLCPAQTLTSWLPSVILPR